jgi:hypothetical protein
VSTRAERLSALEREWWARALRVLVRPREVFAELRDDSRDAAAARQDPIAAIVYVAGVSIFLATPTAAHMADEVSLDALLGLVEVLFAGLLVAFQNFWILGAILALGVRAAAPLQQSVASSREPHASYRQCRHIVGLAGMPFVLELVVVWPVRLALFGSDLFTTGGSDSGSGDKVFHGLDAAFLAWALLLLVIGVRVVHEWTWARSLAAFSLAGVFLTLAVAAVFVL